MRKSAFFVFGGVALMFASSAFASGSASAGAPDGQLGQKVYLQKVACSTCPFSGGIKTRGQKNTALTKISNGKIKMSASEKKAVTAFINSRFKKL